MKKFITALASLALLMGILACNDIAVDPQAQEFSVTAAIERPSDTKLAYENVPEGLLPKWEVGDKLAAVSFVNNKDMNRYGFVVSAIDVNGTATLSLITDKTDPFISHGYIQTTPPADDATVYFIYTAGKTPDTFSAKTTIDISNQTYDRLPTYMFAEGKIQNRTCFLHFTNLMAVVGIRNPKFPGAANKEVTSMQVSGDNVFYACIAQQKTTVVGKEVVRSVEIVSDEKSKGPVTYNCSFKTDAAGVAKDAIIYFALLPLPDMPAADLIFTSTVGGTKYTLNKKSKTLEVGNYYIIDNAEFTK